jgi:hypothetical protein
MFIKLSKIKGGRYMKTTTILFVSLMLTGIALADFEGTYDVEGPEYFAELSLTYQPGPDQGYYMLEWNLGTPGDVYFGAGIEAFGILAGAQLDQDYLTVYTMLDSELTGLLISMDILDEPQIHPELVEDGIVLEPSSPKIPGKYAVESEDNYSQPVDSYTLVLEPLGEILKVTRTGKTGKPYRGVGMVIGEVLVTGVVIDDTKEISILKITDEGLYGDWMDYSYDQDDMVTTGILQATPLE